MLCDAMCGDHGIGAILYGDPELSVKKLTHILSPRGRT